MSLLFRQMLHSVRRRRIETKILVTSTRNLNIIPSLYDDGKDPAPKFFSSDVQTLLKRLSRPDYSKVFRKRTNRGHAILKDPRYKFLTDKELEAEMAKTQEKADLLLQMPPVVKIHEPIEHLLSKDPALTGYDNVKYIFTDISFGVANESRIIVERDVDGTLRSCDHDIRKRLNQAYFPMVGRNIREPIMFSDEERLHSLLDRNEYVFVLDRACVQYEPDEPSYQRVTSITYQHVDMQNNYDLLRSTRHFGPLVFYLSWHQTVDGLMLELVQGGSVREAVCLAAVRHALHGDLAHGDRAQTLAKKVLSTPIQLGRPEQVTEEDIALDSNCMECIESYIANNSAMKSQQELALQGFREMYQQLMDVSRGMRKAHGTA